MRYSEETEQLLKEHNFKLITYDIEQKIIKKLMLDNRFQLIELFKSCGYFIKWENNKFNAKGKKLYTPMKKFNKKEVK